ncbi:MAG: hypothetical protein OXC40_04750 [Proteobacteria bacterium]|nr:hypothetical protein [Pseudomonadota bacterium]
MFPVQFEPDFQKKVLYITFTSAITIDQSSQWLELKQAWCRELRMWHTPYKAFIDMSCVTVKAEESVITSFNRTIDFFKGFYLRKAVIYGLVCPPGVSFSVENFANKSDALSCLGIRESSQSKSQNQSFRSTIVIDNHHERNLVELTFSEEVSFESVEQIATLRSKLTNNLMHWHGQWYLVIDMSNVDDFKQDTLLPFRRMMKFLQGFFLVEAVGFGQIFPDLPKDFPIKFFKTKHRALHYIQKQQEHPVIGQQEKCAGRDMS